MELIITEAEDRMRTVVGMWTNSESVSRVKTTSEKQPSSREFKKRNEENKSNISHSPWESLIKLIEVFKGILLTRHTNYMLVSPGSIPALWKSLLYEILANLYLFHGTV